MKYNICTDHSLICDEYRKHYPETVDEPVVEIKVTPPELVHYRSFTSFQQAAVRHYAHWLIAQMTKRAANALKNFFSNIRGYFFGDFPDNRDRMEALYTAKFDFSAIRNIGVGTLPELVNFRECISSYIFSLPGRNLQSLVTEYTSFVLKTHFDNLPQHFDDLIKQTIEEGGNLNLFSLIDLLVRNDVIFEPARRIVFDYYFSYSPAEIKSLAGLGRLAGITRERERQIKTDMETKIQTWFRFIIPFEELDLSKYGIYNRTRNGKINVSFAKKINQSENVNFSVQFYTIVLSLFYTGA